MHARHVEAVEVVDDWSTLRTRWHLGRPVKALLPRRLHSVDVPLCVQARWQECPCRSEERPGTGATGHSLTTLSLCRAGTVLEAVARTPAGELFQGARPVITW